jgi:catechol 2,3-dioxygenase-like lactoylglutathione lyase family enzyme
MGFSQKATDVSAVSITVGDLDREVDFFVQILDFKKIKVETQKGAAVAKLFGLTEKTATVRIATLQLGKEQIQLMDFDGASEGRPVPADTRSNDLWFQHLAIVVADMDSAYQKLLRNQVQHVSTFPETLPDYLPNAAGIRAFYFRDPEGHNLELIWFPPGKGNVKWQTQNKVGQAGMFLGIDHTAIAIADTKVSMAFYRDALGLEWGGHSENYGPEQEHLNQVFGARLDINGLHAAAGFGVEFLRYIAPPGGRTIPADSRPTDLWHYQTELWVDDLPALLLKLEKMGYAKTSASPVVLDSVDCILLRDPDGHALLLKAAKPSKN